MSDHSLTTTAQGEGGGTRRGIRFLDAQFKCPTWSDALTLAVIFVALTAALSAGYLVAGMPLSNAVVPAAGMFVGCVLAAFGASFMQAPRAFMLLMLLIFVPVAFGVAALV